jgi:Xaa-Pro aminopeptidase
MVNFNERVRDFQTILGTQVDAAFIPLSADLQYLTGVPRDIPNFGATLHPGAWAEGAWLSAKHEPVLVLPRMSAEFGGLGSMTGIQLKIMGDWDDPAATVATILRDFGIGQQPRIALGERALAETAAALHAFLPGAVFSNATQLLRQMRVIKAEDEIAIMRQAGAITEAAFADVLTQLKHGMTELDIISEVDYQLRRHGSLGPSFTTSMYNSGPATPLLFGQREATWKRVLTPPVSLLFDFGAVYEGYCYDYGRTVSFGQPSDEQQRVYDLVMASQRAGIAAMKAGQVTTTQVDAAARKVIEDGGYGSEFRHRLGHGIGMDVHEPPFLTAGDETLIREGMLFTVEPSITQMNSFSARVEDVVVARPGGGEALTTGWQTLIVID